MLKAAATITTACVVYFAIGAAMTAGCYVGLMAAEKIVERFESKEEQVLGRDFGPFLFARGREKGRTMRGIPITDDEKLRVCELLEEGYSQSAIAKKI